MKERKRLFQDVIIRMICKSAPLWATDIRMSNIYVKWFAVGISIACIPVS